MAIQEEQKKEICKGRFILSVPIGIRRSLIDLIKDTAFERNVNIDVEENKGFLTSNFRVKLVGAREDLLEIVSLAKMYAEYVNESLHL